LIADCSFYQATKAFFVVNMDADYIIVGGGTAGCVLASRLHEQHPNASIVMIEAGPNNHDHDSIKNPSAAFFLHGSDYHYNYKTVPQKHADGRQIQTAGGKGLSGSSAVNYGAWTRGDVPGKCFEHVYILGISRLNTWADYDLWAKIVGDEKWSYKGQLPYFKKTETHHTPSQNPDIHGFDGPMHTVQSSYRKYPLGKTVHDAFVKTGANIVDDANNGYPHGLAVYTENWRNAQRQPAGVIYPLDGVNVVLDAWVKRVILEEKDGKLTATGVELVDGRVFKSKQEVIVSAGSYRTPQILMLSGIGPAAELEKHNIKVLLNSPEVGKNLHDHVVFVQYWRLKHPEKALSAGAPDWMSNATYLEGAPADYIFTGTVPEEEMKKALSADGETVDSKHPQLDPPRGHYELIVCYAPVSALQSEIATPFDGSIIGTCCLQLLPTARGTITISSTDVRDDPVIDPNHLATEVDRTIVREGARRAMRAIETPEFQEHIAEEFVPEGYKAITSSSAADEIDARVRRSASNWWHPAGTASMGTVVDTDLKVNGVAKLRVVDASVIPTPIAAHYQAVVYALAEQAADIIGKEYKA
jgi:choline dehydrogenase-like flavoprotein